MPTQYWKLLDHNRSFHLIKKHPILSPILEASSPVVWIKGFLDRNMVIGMKGDVGRPAQPRIDRAAALV